MLRRTTGKSHSPEFCILFAEPCLERLSAFENSGSEFQNSQASSQPSSFDPFSSAPSLARWYINDIPKIKKFLLMSPSDYMHKQWYKPLVLQMLQNSPDFDLFYRGYRRLEKWFMSILKNNEI